MGTRRGWYRGPWYGSGYWAPFVTTVFPCVTTVFPCVTVVILVLPWLSWYYRGYPGVSWCIPVYPGVSRGIPWYPGVSRGIRVGTVVSGLMPWCPGLRHCEQTLRAVGPGGSHCL